MHLRCRKNYHASGKRGRGDGSRRNNAELLEGAEASPYSQKFAQSERNLADAMFLSYENSRL